MMETLQILDTFLYAPLALLAERERHTENALHMLLNVFTKLVFQNRKKIRKKFKRIQKK